jgi:nitrate reductase NapE component
LRLAVTILVAVALACVVGFVVWLLTYEIHGLLPM